MSNWREPITDRTLQDVKRFDADSLEYQKGALNASDLNRIEDNYKYLMAKLRSDAIFIPHRLRNFTETVLEYMEKDVLPEGCTRLAHIESSGTQFFDTGILCDNTSVYEVEFSCVPNGSAMALMGCQMDSSTRAMVAYFGNTYFGFTSGSISATNSVCRIEYTAGEKYAGSFVIDASQKTINATVNGAVLPTQTYTGTLNTSSSIYLLNNNGQSGQQFIGQLDYMKIKKNGTLIRDYVPCTNASGTAVLYDIVNDVFCADAAGGTFTAGAEVVTEPTYELVEIKTTYTDWQEHNLPWLSEINRIRANYNALVRLFLVGLGLPILAESNYLDYTEVNNWERIAAACKTIFENMEQEYRYCGMEVSGGDRLL